MSLSNHALTFLKRHYRALFRRAYALGLAPIQLRYFHPNPNLNTPSQHPTSRNLIAPALALVVVVTGLTGGPWLEEAQARQWLSGKVISGTNTQGLTITSFDTYTVADGTKFQGINENDDLYGRVPPLSKQPPKTALCAVPAITLKLFVVIIRAINRQKARYLWLFASKWQSTVQVGK